MQYTYYTASFVIIGEGRTRENHRTFILGAMHTRFIPVQNTTSLKWLLILFSEPDFWSRVRGTSFPLIVPQLVRPWTLMPTSLPSVDRFESRLIFSYSQPNPNSLLFASLRAGVSVLNLNYPTRLTVFYRSNNPFSRFHRLEHLKILLCFCATDDHQSFHL
jgi:hypothetical protein